MKVLKTLSVIALCAWLLALVGTLVHSQEPNDPSFTSANFGDYPLTPGETLPGTSTKVDVCTDKFVTAPELSHEQKAEMFVHYGYPEKTWGNYTAMRSIPYGLGGSGNSMNLLPIDNNAIIGVVQKNDLDTKLRNDVCHGTDDINQTRSLVAQDWFKLYILKFGEPK